MCVSVFLVVVRIRFVDASQKDEEKTQDLMALLSDLREATVKFADSFDTLVTCHKLAQPTTSIFSWQGEFLHVINTFHRR